jgi:hypothetical protein
VIGINETSPAIQQHCPEGYVFALQIEEPLSVEEVARLIARVLQPPVDPKTCVVVPGHYSHRKRRKQQGFYTVAQQTGWMVFRPNPR